MSGKFDFTRLGIGKLLHQGHLVVPPNQRPYAWEERHVLDLFHDLHEAITNDDEDYFLGTIVLVQSAQNENPSIADGQQRLATTTILLARIRDKLFELGRAGRARSLDSDFLRNIDLDSEEMVPRLQLNVADHEFFTSQILLAPFDLDGATRAEPAEPIRQSHRRLRSASDAAVEFLDDILKTMKQEAKADYLVRWVRFIENSATIVAVTAPDDIGAFRMFETLNDRGLRASQADILKNYFFSKAPARDHEAQALWNGITGAIESLGDDENDRLVTYFRHLWITTHGPTKERELAAKIKREITGQTKTVRFLADANSAVNDYVALWSESHLKWSGYKRTTRQHLRTIVESLKVEQIRPLLFAVARHFDPVEADKAFRLFVSWSVRFLIYGGRGGMLDHQYSLRAQDVGQGTMTKAWELRAAMSEYVPTDAQFEDAFATVRVSRAHLARYYLRALDKTLKNDPSPEYVANEDEATINLEHVMPLTLSEDWDVDPDIQSTARRLLGNMVLVRASQNRDLGNGSFKEKKKAFAQSSYAITSQVAGFKDWSADQIRQRQREMAKIAVRTWPLEFGDR